jgi:hypothetical protein
MPCPINTLEFFPTKTPNALRIYEYNGQQQFWRPPRFGGKDRSIFKETDLEGSFQLGKGDFGQLDFEAISYDFTQNTPKQPRKVKCVTYFKVEKA